MVPRRQMASRHEHGRRGTREAAGSDERRGAIAGLARRLLAADRRLGRAIWDTTCGPNGNGFAKAAAAVGTVLVDEGTLLPLLIGSWFFVLGRQRLGWSPTAAAALEGESAMCTAEAIVEACGGCRRKGALAMGRHSGCTAASHSERASGVRFPEGPARQLPQPPHSAHTAAVLPWSWRSAPLVAAQAYMHFFCLSAVETAIKLVFRRPVGARASARSAPDAQSTQTGSQRANDVVDLGFVGLLHPPQNSSQIYA